MDEKRTARPEGPGRKGDGNMFWIGLIICILLTALLSRWDTGSVQAEWLLFAAAWYLLLQLLFIESAA